MTYDEFVCVLAYCLEKDPATIGKHDRVSLLALSSVQMAELVVVLEERVPVDFLKMQDALKGSIWDMYEALCAEQE